jgi:hypothetical protein
MSTSITLQVSGTNVLDIVDQINAAHDQGRSITVNGHPVVTVHGQPAASAYLNGTLAVSIAAKVEGKTKPLFVKVGHMADITSDLPDEESAPEPQEAEEEPIVEDEDTTPVEADSEPTKAPTVKAERVILEATYKGETGYLATRRIGGKIAYAVTMDPKKASPFTASASLDRHIARATAAGLEVLVAA